MPTAAIIVAGLGLLVVAGAYQLFTARLSGPDAKRTQLVSPESTTFTHQDRKHPSRILSEGPKIRNALVVVLEVMVIVMSVWMAIYVFSTPGIPLAFELLVVAALVVGTTLVGRGLYVRLGLYSPVTVQESLRATFDADVAAELTTLGDVAGTARGDETLDEATVGLLAAARQGEALESVTGWSEAENVADAETITERTDRLVQAGVLQEDEGRIEVGPQLADADADQLVTVAATVLN